MRVILICCLAFMPCVSCVVAYDNTPIVVMREDDGWLSCKDRFPEFGDKSFLDYGKQLSIPVTWAIITDRPAKGTTLNWQEYIDYVTSAGGELASHSATHSPMSSLQAYVDDVLLSKRTIEANTPYTCNTFLQPGTWTADAYFDSYTKIGNILWQAIQNNFRQSQLYLGQIGIGSPALMHGLMASIDIDYVSRPVVADFLKSIDYISNTPGLIYVIQFHGIQSPTGVTDYCTRSDLMAALLINLNQLRNEGKIRLLSIDDAYSNNQFSPDINLIFDSGFEFSSPELAKYLGIWALSSGNAIVDNIGCDSSKCGRLVSGGITRREFLAHSGKYKLTWMQKPDNGTPLNAYVTPKISTMYPWTDAVFAPKYSNNTNDWEQKCLVLRIPDTFLNRIRCQFSATNSYLVDNVSMRLVSPSPNDTVTDFKVAPTPIGIKFSWRSPDDASFTKIAIRYSSLPQCPQTMSEGTLLKQVSADNGEVQTLFYPFNWNDQYSVYFSIFAVKDDNTFSEPDVSYLSVDSQRPLVTINSVSQQGNDMNISWTPSSTTSSIFSGIYSSYYAVGTSPNATNVIDWTLDNDCSVQLSSLQSGTTYFLSIKSQNIYGVWSDTVTGSFIVEETNLMKLSEKDDGSAVIVKGIVSAIFDDCYYIESENRIRGIKIIGPSSSLSLGMNVTIHGVLHSFAGERYITAQSIP